MAPHFHRPCSSRKRIGLSPALALGVLLLAATGCGDDSDDPTPATDPGPTGTATAPEGTAETNGDPPELTSLDGVSVDLEQVAELDRPISLASRSGTQDVYVSEQDGRLRRISLDGDGSYDVADQVVLDLTDEVDGSGERGLIGFDFSPDGEQLYVHYSDLDGHTNVDEYEMDGNNVLTDTRRQVFFTEQPLPNHNGGQLTFGPDGYLYLALGDGGGAGDPGEHGQDPTTVLGAILRIDPDSDNNGYTIPNDNPFADGDAGAPEVWVYGLRNPWRFSFDSANGDLWIADVGQAEVEEINWLPADDGLGRGANMGWPVLEGTEQFSGEEPTADMVDPIFEYRHGDGVCSITGGYLYRGSMIENMQGTYIYGDLCVPEIRGLLADEGQVLDEQVLGPGPDRITAFGEDGEGELWVLSHEGGVYRIIPG